MGEMAIAEGTEAAATVIGLVREVKLRSSDVLAIKAGRHTTLD